ncbi:MAG: hypothetical protein WBW73_12610 [Rhodoplanes sp.]
MRFHVEPGDVPPEVAARRLGLTVEQFEQELPELLAIPASRQNDRSV